MNAINAYNRLNANVAGLKKASEKLSSGYRINRAGDDAAGLAISEKMRSQIKGLNQATRNAQDGINMIQTFEGAAQETHSILQRMKELASEAANGTYDNMTDRAAVQLEFDQLNDELNQIADTDFNGTVVLNGGEMSDGLKSVDGEFNYKNKVEQVTKRVTEKLDADIADKAKALAAAEAELKKQPFDLSYNGNSPEWNTVDNHLYDKTVADKLWKDLGLKTGTGANEKADVSQGDTVNITFEYQDDGTWKAISGNATVGGNEVKTFKEADLTAAGIATTSMTVTDATGKGGFVVKSTSNSTSVDTKTASLGNVVFNAYDAKKGDTVTLTYTNADPSQYAPTNVGLDMNSVEIKSTGTTDLTLTVEQGAVKDTEMTDDIKKALDGLEELEFEAKYGTTANQLDSVTLGGVDIYATSKFGGAAGGGVVTIKGIKYHIQGADDAKGGAITISSVESDGTTKGKELAKINIVQAGATAATAGSVKGKLSVSISKFEDTSSQITIKPGSNSNLKSSTALTKVRDEAKAALKAAQDKKADVLSDTKDEDGVVIKTSWEKIKENLGEKASVSVSDTYDNSTARMTYTDNITLQTGARTKDAVNFTFKYNTDGTADMGKLEPNLNLSSRADGLNTANLTLSNQKDANYAIDQIDKAINKTSMVRATFGSIQNRLEHKITNLTTTSENLTEAESSIRDTDMASEMMNYTKFNILQQAAQSMLAQANQQPQSVLQLLG